MDDIFLEQKPYILIIDEHPDNLLVLRTTLASTKYGIVECLSGEEALSILKERDFNLILIDADMSGMNGIETARQLRCLSRHKYTPLIFMTALYIDEESVLEDHNIGAIDYLFRPFSTVVLKKKVEFFIDYPREVKLEQKLLDTHFRSGPFLHFFNQLVNPLWVILLNVQLLKHFSLRDKEKYIRILSGKIDLIEVNARRIKQLLVRYKQKIDSMLTESESTQSHHPGPQ